MAPDEKAQCLADRILGVFRDRGLVVGQELGAAKLDAAIARWPHVGRELARTALVALLKNEMLQTASMDSYWLTERGCAHLISLEVGSEPALQKQIANAVEAHLKGKRMCRMCRSENIELLGVEHYGQLLNCQYHCRDCGLDGTFEGTMLEP